MIISKVLDQPIFHSIVVRFDRLFFGKIHIMHGAGYTVHLSGREIPVQAVSLNSQERQTNVPRGVDAWGSAFEDDIPFPPEEILVTFTEGLHDSRRHGCRWCTRETP